MRFEGDRDIICNHINPNCERAHPRGSLRLVWRARKKTRMTMPTEVGGYDSVTTSVADERNGGLRLMK